MLRTGSPSPNPHHRGTTDVPLESSFISVAGGTLLYDRRARSLIRFQTIASLNRGHVSSNGERNS